MPPTQAQALVRELKGLRRGAGITESKLLGTPHLTNLPPIVAMVTDQDTGTNRARAVIALIHDFLHHLQQDRDFRALAWAFNLDVSEPWQGEPIRLSNQQLTDRRKQLAPMEHVSEDGSKPMLDWENEAISTMATEFSNRTTPTINLDGSPWTPPPEATDPPEQTQQAEPADQPSTEASQATDPPPQPQPAVQAVPERSKRQWKPLTAALLIGAIIGASAMFFFDGESSDGDTAVTTTVAEATATSERGQESASDTQGSAAQEDAAAAAPTSTAAPEPTAAVEPTEIVEPTVTRVPTPEATATTVPTPTPSRRLRQHRRPHRFRMQCLAST